MCGIPAHEAPASSAAGRSTRRRRLSGFRGVPVSDGNTRASSPGHSNAMRRLRRSDTSTPSSGTFRRPCLDLGGCTRPRTRARRTRTHGSEPSSRRCRHWRASSSDTRSPVAASSRNIRRCRGCTRARKAASCSRVSARTSSPSSSKRASQTGSGGSPSPRALLIGAACLAHLRSRG